MNEWSYGVMVSTLVSDAIDPSSILGKTSFFKYNILYYNFNVFIKNCNIYYYYT